MTNGTDLPRMDEILDYTLKELDHAGKVLWKAATRLQPDYRIGSPLTGAQVQARTVALGAIDDAKAAIDRAKAALYDALRTDDPPRP
jgi:hypothetical protein